MRLACVVQRYGAEIAGGSEAHCRGLAERLAGRHQVDVLTTTARDYLTWRNAFPEGWSEEAGVRVGRFAVARQRHLPSFATLTEQVLDGRPSEDEQQAWFTANGPESPELLAHLRQHGREYDLVLFWTFRYFPSFFGLPLVADRAVLLPTAEEDGILELPVLRRFFATPRGLLFLTPEERDLVAARVGASLPPWDVVGSGLEPRPAVSADASADVERLVGTSGPFVLYLGRVDPNKGCDQLFDFFLRAAQEDHFDVPLVLAGPVHMPVPAHPLVKVLGYVTDATREALLDRALALMMPSPYESLSMVLLEAWNHGVPALVNGRCAVLRGQVRRADGGLSYATYRQFSEALQLLIERPDIARQLGRQGLEYVEAHYRWPVVLDRVERFLAELVARRASSGAIVDSLFTR